MSTSIPVAVFRPILTRSSGHRHGPITRMMSPGDLGQQLKPFIFLDAIEAPAGGGPRFGFHPHSGIATLTFPLNFNIRHETSTGQVDEVAAGGVEWVVTGGGIWHRAQPMASGDAPLIQGFQLWLALPPSHELAEPSARFLSPAEVPRSGPARVLLGRYGDAQSPINAPMNANYLWVELAAGEGWTYQPPAGHRVGWVHVQTGALSVAGQTLERELAVFQPGEEPLSFQAGAAPCGFLLGSAVPHAPELALGNYSVHTTVEALQAGERRIADIGQTLRPGR